MKVCAVICRKATFTIPDANPLLFEHKIWFFVRFWGLEPSFSGISSTKLGFLCFFALRNPCFLAFQAQNRYFCALLPSGTPVFGHSSTKSRFLCAFCLRNPYFRPFQAQNRDFCALLPFKTHIFGLFEHKIGVCVRFWGLEPSFSGVSSTKSAFLCSSRGESGIGKRNRGDV